MTGVDVVDLKQSVGRLGMRIGGHGAARFKLERAEV